MRTIRETVSLLLSPLRRRLDVRRQITQQQWAGFSASMTGAARIADGRLVRPRRSVLRAIVVALGPRRVIQILHETGAIYPCWGLDANDAPFFAWVESNPPNPDEEADHG
jgi:hypothetical protein